MNTNASSLRFNPNGDCPQVDKTAYIDPSAQIIGNVRIGPQVYVGPNAVIRADEIKDGSVSPIQIGPQTNIQDGVIIHALGGTSVTIGSHSTCAHGSIIHGPCYIGDNCFVGFGAKVFNASVANGTYIGTAAVVQGVSIPDQSSIPPAAAVLSDADASKYAGAVSPDQRAFMDEVIAANLHLAKTYPGRS